MPDEAPGAFIMLNDILKTKRRELAAAQERRPLREIKARVRDLPPPRDFLQAVAPFVKEGAGDEGRGAGIPASPFPSSPVPRPSSQLPEGDRKPRTGDLALIAEIKRASPSRGVMNAGLDPSALAGTYAAAGARALSVLTDAAFFRGSPDDLKAARAAAGIPVLRKDFTLDPYHVWEAREMGADAVLLIARILARGQMQDLAGLAAELGLAALFEIHRGDELPPVIDCKPKLIGVNSRDLDTFQVSLDACEKLRFDLPRDVARVAESGIATREDVERMAACGYHAVLVGETLVKSGDPAAKVRELLGVKTQDPPPFAPATMADLKALPPVDEALGGGNRDHR
jgi:indole-3-glycerol phosphate synthase